MEYKKPYLEKYDGVKSRHECPECGDPHSFTYYLDGNTGKPIHPTVGRCNHESSCGYHYTPKQFFIDNPHLKEQQERKRESLAEFAALIRTPNAWKQESPATSYIDFKRVDIQMKNNGAFLSFLHSLFNSDETVQRLKKEYYLGATKAGNAIFWQIDSQRRVRTGKIIKYNPVTGHRIKDGSGVNWVHSLLIKKGFIQNDFTLKQCLFGEHLLSLYPDKVVALVEAEKTAVIAAGVYTDFIWLATGGKSQLSKEKLQVLRGRTVIMFPDVDGFNEWTEKAKEIRTGVGCRVVVSDILEKNATQEERENKIDIADWLVKGLGVSASTRLHELQARFKPLRTLVNGLGLELLSR